MREVAGVTPQQVLQELAEIAFALPGEEGGLPVKVADKLKALELLGKNHALFTDRHELDGVQAVIEVQDYDE